MPQETEQDGQEILSLVVAAPLSELLKECEIHCVAACCGTNAFDDNAYTILHWLRKVAETKAEKASEQLESLAQAAQSYQGAVEEREVICDKWKSGNESAAYWRNWQSELVRAIRYQKHGCPSPTQRLHEAEAMGAREFASEVYRMTNETHN